MKSTLLIIAIGITSFFTACEQAKDQVAETVAEVIVSKEDKKAALQAAKDGEQETLFALLEKGVDLEEQNAFKCTPLILALESKHNDLALALYEKGANIKHEDNNHTPAWMAAIFARNYPLVEKMLADGLDVNSTVNGGHFGGRTMLYQASAIEETELVKILLKYKADPNFGPGVHYASEKPLDNLKYSDNEELKKILIDAGATYSEPKED